MSLSRLCGHEVNNIWKIVVLLLGADLQKRGIASRSKTGQDEVSKNTV